MKNKKTWTELILGGILSAGGLISCIVGVIGYEPAEKINKDEKSTVAFYHIYVTTGGSKEA